MLIYATNNLSPLCSLAKEVIIEGARIQGLELVISSQVLREYLAAATRIRLVESGIPLQKIIENLNTFQKQFVVLPEVRGILPKLIELVQEYPTAGKQVHDANIVATMLAHEVETLLTHNVEDFERYSEKIRILPLEKSDNI